MMPAQFIHTHIHTHTCRQAHTHTHIQAQTYERTFWRHVRERVCECVCARAHVRTEAPHVDQQNPREKNAHNQQKKALTLTY